MPRKIVELLRDFLAERHITVRVEDQMSGMRAVKAGVPQGSCLSPVCYAWYTDDIPVVGQAQLALYADDAAFYASSYRPAFAARRLQPTLDALPEWLDKWRLAVNVGKTQAILTGRTQLPDCLKLKGQEIPWQHTVTYLGVTIDRGLTFKQHIAATIGKVKGARAKLRPILSSNLPLQTKISIYKTYLRPRITYAAPAWYPFTSVTGRNKLQAQENLSLRTIVGAPRYVRNDTIRKDLKMETVDTFVRSLTEGMFAKADESQHAHIKGIAPLHARPPDMPGKRKLKPYSRDFLDKEEDHSEMESKSTYARREERGRGRRAGEPPPGLVVPAADRSAGPPLGNQGSHPARLDREVP